jgi:hypothetical protein
MDEYSAGTLARQYARGTAVAAVVIAAGWHLVYDLVAQLASWPDYRWPLVAMTAWVGYSAVMVVCARGVLGAAGEARWPGLMTGCTLAISVAVGVACQGQVMRHPGWAFGSVMWLAILALWGRPLRQMVWFYVVNVAVNAALVVTFDAYDQVSLARFLVAAYGAGALQLGFVFGARALTYAAGWAVDAADRRSAEDIARREADEVHRTRYARYLELGRTTAPTLARLADGSGDPADPAVRRSCAAAASRLRRLIAETDDLPDALLHELRASADMAERQGVIVDLIKMGDVPPLPREVRRALCEFPIDVLTATRSFARITVASTDEYVAVGVVADADLDPTLHDLSSNEDVEISCRREGVQLWAHTQWRPRSLSR